MRVKKKNIVIVGTGGFAQEVEWLLNRSNQINPEWNFCGFIDNDLSKHNTQVVGDDAYILHAKKIMYVVIAIGDSHIREKIHCSYKRNKNIKFPNLLDPSVMLSQRVKLGEGNIICAQSIITTDIEIGDCCIVNLNCTIGHDVKIGSYTTINPGVNISGNVVIGCRSNIGTGSQIIQGIEIGESVTLGAGGVVVKNLPRYCTAVGVPAKIIKLYNTGEK